MNQPGSHLDLSRCPVCGQANQCAMEKARFSGQPQPPCWCSTLKFDDALTQQIPAAKQGLVCLCQECSLSMGGTV
ncbi:MAG: cysteine-rich CWC family protein [Burkholderiaceae bacterium]